MAGEWIKFDKATIDKPEVLALAELLSTSEDDVVGKLLRVWCWFDSQSRDGHAGNVTDVTLMKFIDRLVASQGFAACMKKVGWLTDSGIPNFDRHNGESSKNRALAKDRKAKERSRECHDENVTREEKRREEVIQPLRVVNDTFGRFWETWPSTERKVAKAKCAEVWQRRHLEPLADQIITHVASMKETEQWRKFSPAPLTYLNQRRWEDGAVAGDRAVTL